MRKLLAILLALVLVVGLVACGGSSTDTPAASGTDQSAEATTGETGEAQAEAPVEREAGTLVIGSDSFNGIFSHFDATSAYDTRVCDAVQGISLIELDKNAEPTDEGLSEYNEPEKEVQEDGSEGLVYKFKIKDGITFSDGSPVTVDDVIFTFKVYLDPNYTGNATLYTLPIKGALAYKYDDANYQEALDKIEAEVAAYEPTDEEIEAKAQALTEEYKGAGYDVALEDFQKDGSEFEGETLAGLIEDKRASLTSDYVNKNLEDGIDVPEIEGIEKIDDQSFNIHLTKLDPKAIYSLTVNIESAKYYGEGFEKGKLDSVKAKEKEPFGAGPFVFESYKNNVVSLAKNDKFYRGAPLFDKLKFQVVDNKNKIQAVARGDVDISDPSASNDNIEECEKHDNIHYELVDNNGYGYIGLNAKRLTDKAVRQGFMYLMDRTPAVEAAFGDLASVIERPISRTNWAYPADVTEYYGFNPEKALEKFKEAGYEQVDGKLVKDGKQLHITATYPGGDSDDHPVKPVFTTLKTEAEKLGAIVDLQNMQGGPFFEALDSGTLDMWAAAWQSTPDPDMTQLYKSDAPSNRYGIANEELDKLIEAGIQTMDIEERKVIYAKALDLIMEEAVEMPFYQKKNMFIYNTDVLDIDSLPDELTPYWDHYNRLEKLAPVAQ